ncbi:MAG: thiamine pyrophosphate-binding protein [Rhodobacteraceae bacterium]|jgi:acetolactate synthase-1/2/3 large subunit|nr:thiamine pyrophosphate-binding protein [Paracoccaceae bacterium]
MRHGGQVLIDQLKIQGVERVFCVPGESYLAALDGLYDSGIETVIGRQEGGVAMMAEAHGKLTGAPGIAFVTRGPGATNASAGVHVASQDSTPMILFIGQVASDQKDREAFQEIDYGQMFGSIAKWVAQIDRTDRIVEYVSRAFHIAQSGRPGPVVLALPEDMLSAFSEGGDAPKAHGVALAASGADAIKIAARLQAAERPLVIVGGGVWSAKAAADMARFATRFELPVGTAFRRQDYFDNRHPHYAGDVGIGINPALADKVKQADVILALGTRLGEITSGGYGLFDIPKPKQRLIHVYPDATELGRIYHADQSVACSPVDMARALAELEPDDDPLRDSTWRQGLYQAYCAWGAPQHSVGDVKMEQIIGHVNQVLPETAIVTNGAGNYAAWLHRYFDYKTYGSQLAPTSGSMGYGLPAAVAAKLAYRNRDVICFAGDGCFQMTMQEFGTAAQYGANIVVIISNNGIYGTIRMHQEQHYPGRVSGTVMHNPKFAALAQSYGGHGEVVRKTDEFPAAFERARTSNLPAIIELITDPRALSSRLNLP